MLHRNRTADIWADPQGLIMISRGGEKFLAGGDMCDNSWPVGAVVVA